MRYSWTICVFNFEVVEGEGVIRVVDCFNTVEGVREIEGCWVFIIAWEVKARVSTVLKHLALVPEWVANGDTIATVKRRTSSIDVGEEEVDEEKRR